MKIILRIALFNIILLLFDNSALYAQSDDGNIYPTNKATLVGAGNINLYDTYLSPLKYSGWSLHVLNERMKRNSWFHNKFTWQQLINLDFASAKNPAKNAREYSFLLGYSWGGHYDLYRKGKFRLKAGGLWNVTGGVLYNQRNSNNPASVKAYSNINLSVISFYDWKSITFRGQIYTPLIGVAFSPEYDQSYYEISLDNNNKTINFASLHNQRAIQFYFTADIPVSKVTVRLGYLGSFYQTKIHNILSHNYANSFMIGLVAESINFSGNKIKNNNKILKNSSYY